jgi:hypothetical protein
MPIHTWLYILNNKWTHTIRKRTANNAHWLHQKNSYLYSITCRKHCCNMPLNQHTSLSSAAIWQHPTNYYCYSVQNTFWYNNTWCGTATALYNTYPVGRGSSAPVDCPLCVIASWAPDTGACAVAVPLTTGTVPPVPIPELGTLFVPLLVTGELLAAEWGAAEKLI